MRVLHVTSDTFDTTVQQGIVLLDFWAEWCGPCRAFGPIFEAAAERHADVVFAKIDTDAEGELSAKLNVRSIPTVMAFRDGVLVYSKPGLLSATQVDALVASLKAVEIDDAKRRATTPVSVAS